MKAANLKILYLFCCLFCLTACVTSLGPVTSVSDSEIKLSDRRSADEKKSFRDGITSPLVMLGDGNFDRDPMLYIKESLHRNKTPEIAHIDVVINKFRVMDYFPRRMAAAQGGAMVGALGAMGYGAIVRHGPLPDSDAILCVMEGSINGKPFVADARNPYHLSSFVAGVRSDKHWKEAVRKSIDDCAISALSQTVGK